MKLKDFQNKVKEEGTQNKDVWAENIDLIGNKSMNFLNRKGNEKYKIKYIREYYTLRIFMYDKNHRYEEFNIKKENDIVEFINYYIPIENESKNIVILTEELFNKINKEKFLSGITTVYFNNEEYDSCVAIFSTRESIGNKKLPIYSEVELKNKIKKLEKNMYDNSLEFYRGEIGKERMYIHIENTR